MAYAIVTGASSGIGLEFARIFASDNINVVMVSRNEKLLLQKAEEVRIDFGVDVITIAKDLSNSESVVEIYNDIKRRNIEIEYLINNAGFGDVGRLVSTKWEKQKKMIDVNIISLTYLTRLFLPDMMRRGHGRILNVASTAAFQPGPFMSVYYASKAFVLSFSEAIAYEAKGSGVKVTTLCPGPTKSNFQIAASMGNIKLVDRNMASASEVAMYGYKAMLKGKRLVIHGMTNRIVAICVKFLPRSIVMYIVTKLHESRG